MADVTLVGGGTRIRDCAELLSRAGFSLRHAFDLDTGDLSPVIIGEVPGAFQLARQAVEVGHHVLIAGTSVLTPERLSLLLEHRRHAQGLFVWSDRRHHPGYRFVAGLMESDSIWQPRYIRQDVLSTEQPASALFRWRALEAITLFTGITRSAPRTVEATVIVNPIRNAPDLARVTVSFKDVEAELTVGLGEAIERRETLVASATRKAYVDELDPDMPVRIIDDEPANANTARKLSLAAASPEEIARQQSVSFLESTLRAQDAVEEAAVWRQSLAALAAMEESFATRAPSEVVVPQEEPRFRVVDGFRTTPPSVA